METMRMIMRWGVILYAEYRGAFLRCVVSNMLSKVGRFLCSPLFLCAGPYTEICC